MSLISTALSPVQSKPLSQIEQLPPECIGLILHHINSFTGSEGILNKKDIAVVMQYAKNLAYTSKTLYAKVNHFGASRTFIESLSRTYKFSEEYFASLWNTHGARKWLWEKIQKNGDKESYQIIQDICALASQITKEAEDAGLSLRHQKICPTLNPYSDQTQNGFIFYLENNKFSNNSTA